MLQTPVDKFFSVPPSGIRIFAMQSSVQSMAPSSPPRLRLRLFFSFDNGTSTPLSLAHTPFGPPAHPPTRRSAWPNELMTSAVHIRLERRSTRRTSGPEGSSKVRTVLPMVMKLQSWSHNFDISHMNCYMDHGSNIKLMGISNALRRRVILQCVSPDVAS